MIGLAQAAVEIEAPRERVFELFTTVAGIERWMAESAEIDLRPGGGWRWTHDNGAIASGEYVEVCPPELLVFTYGWESGPHASVAPGSTTVEVRFDDLGGRTRVRLEHRDLAPEPRAAHERGWTYFIGLLAAVAGGGSTPDERLPRPTN